jgi:hypothetical protein
MRMRVSREHTCFGKLQQEALQQHACVREVGCADLHLDARHARQTVRVAQQPVNDFVVESVYNSAAASSLLHMACMQFFVLDMENKAKYEHTYENSRNETCMQSCKQAAKTCMEKAMQAYIPSTSSLI